MATIYATEQEEKQPWYVWLYTMIAGLFHYIVSGQWIVDIVRWMIKTAGTVSESAFLLATVYVTINTVAHLLVSWLLPDNIIVTLNQVSVIAFSVLPELIVASAIKVTIDHWLMVLKNHKRVDCWAWAILYTLPTLVFLAMTIITICSFVTLEANQASAVAFQATGLMLVIRCLSGWWYGMVQILFVAIGKDGYRGIFNRLESTIAGLRHEKAARDEHITGLQAEVVKLNQQLAESQQQLIQVRMEVATRNLNRRKSDNLEIESDTDELQSVTFTNESDSEQNTSDRYVTAVEKRDKVKREIEQAITRGEKINLRKISNDTGVSYTTTRKYAPDIVKQITQEMPALRLHIVGE